MLRALSGRARRRARRRLDAGALPPDLLALPEILAALGSLTDPDLDTDGDSDRDTDGDGRSDDDPPGPSGPAGPAQTVDDSR